MAHANEQLGSHFRELLSPEQAAALDRVRRALCEQERNKLVQPSPAELEESANS